MNNFGDFEETKENEENGQVSTPVNARARLPRGNEKIGLIKQRLGGNRMEVQTTDNKTWNCRVPGRFKRSMWLRPEDIVLIEPWEGDNEKADVIYKYTPSEVTQLKKRGFLNSLKREF